MIASRLARALARSLPEAERARVEAFRLRDAGFGTDRFGLDRRRLAPAYAVAYWMHERWFRVDSVGHANIPADGPAVVVSNHSGVLPYDGLMISCDVFRHSQPTRLCRYMVDYFVYSFPYLGLLFRSLGQLPGTRANFDGLVADGHIVGVFPEGAKALSKPRHEAYHMLPFTHGHVELAARHGAPIVPCGVVGAEEQLDQVAELEALARLLKVPSVPLTTTFVIPKPVRYYLSYGEPIEVDPDALASIGLRRREVARVRAAVEAQIDRGLARRRADPEGEHTPSIRQTLREVAQTVVERSRAGAHATEEQDVGGGEGGDEGGSSR